MESSMIDNAGTMRFVVVFLYLIFVFKTFKYNKFSNISSLQSSSIILLDESGDK